MDIVNESHISIIRGWEHFDSAWYLNEYGDVSLLGMDPAFHYLWLGARIGRKPSAGFTLVPGRHYRVDTFVRDIEQGRFSSQAESADAGAYSNEEAAAFIDRDEGDMSVAKDLRVAVHAHIYYTDLAEEFVWHLSQMCCQFDLYISTPSEKSSRALEEMFSKIPQVVKADVRVTPNVGRDIAPMLVEFGAELANYDIVGHIHTKKSLYNDGATIGWREYILEALFENPGRIAQFFDLLGKRRYGIIYPQSFYNLPYMAHTWLANADLAQAWSARFGLAELPHGYFDFPAGSMFWARVDAIQPLLEAGLNWRDFPPEQGQTDGTLAHCIERMLGVVPSSRHFQHGVIRDERWPSWSRWRLNQFTDRPVSRYRAMIADPATRVVAFDIFDTLLVRPFLDPDHVKAMVAAEQERAGWTDFRESRVRSEAAARNAKGGDVDIHEIYEHFANFAAGGMEAPTPDREITLELRSVRPRAQVVQLLRFALEQRKKVVLVSDTFLPRPVVEEMLQRCDVKGWSELYLSCERGVRKDSGKLYDLVLAREKIRPHEIVMIGDNERSDCQIPTDMGIQTIHLMRPADLMRATPRLCDIVPEPAAASVADQFLFGSLAAESFSAINPTHFSADNMFGESARAIGYGLLGPIAVVFSQWLLGQATQHGLSRLYFLAREGKFLKQAFDVWQAGKAQALPSDYLLISRRAITVPCIQSIDDILAIAASNTFHGAPMPMFLHERFGVSLDEKSWQACERAKLWSRDRPLWIFGDDVSHIVPFLKHIAPTIISRARLEKAHALDYLRKVGLTGAQDSAVVDVGYGATIQAHLIKLLDQRVHGLYLMTSRQGQALGAGADVLSKGCFVEGAEERRSAPPMYADSFLLEKMLSADDEQVMHYTAAAGAKFRKEDGAADPSRQTRQALQQGAMDFVRDAVRFREEMGHDLPFGKERCEQLFARFVRDISLAEKAHLASLVLDDFYCGRGLVAE